MYTPIVALHKTGSFLNEPNLASFENVVEAGSQGI
jgi:hypothetical protein